jgi:hypothetical protein
MEILLWAFFAYSTCNILIYASNFKWWRNLLAMLGKGDYSLYKLFTCMMCLPTWVGFFMSFMSQRILNVITPSVMYGVENIWASIFIDGVITSGIVWLIHTVQEKLEYRKD